MIAVLLGIGHESILIGQRCNRHDGNSTVTVVYLFGLLFEGKRRDREHIDGCRSPTRGSYLIVDPASNSHDFRGYLQFVRERQNDQLHAVSRYATARLCRRRRWRPINSSLFQFAQSIARIAGITTSRRTPVSRWSVSGNIRTRSRFLLRLRAELGSRLGWNSQGTRHGFQQVPC